MSKLSLLLLVALSLVFSGCITVKKEPTSIKVDPIKIDIDVKVSPADEKANENTK